MRFLAVFGYFGIRAPDRAVAFRMVASTSGRVTGAALALAFVD